MNAKDLKVIVIGIGEMGKAGVQALLEHRLSIVAAVDINPELTGRDVAEISGCPPIGVKIESSLKEAVLRTHPNLAFSAADPGMDNIFQDMKLLAENHINVVTTIMDPFWPIPSTREQFDALDQIFKENGVSLFASGINDIWWSGIGMDLCGTCRSIHAVDFTNKLPLENMGAGVARDFRVNGDPEKYRKDMDEIDLSLEESVQGPLMALYADTAILGLHVTHQEITAKPIIAGQNMPMPQWDMTIEAGKMQGQEFRIRFETRENILMSTSMIIKVMNPGEKPGTSWTIKGEPDLHVELGDICGEITTSATTVNRIPDVLHADPGIVTLADIPARPLFRTGEWKTI